MRKKVNKNKKKAGASPAKSDNRINNPRSNVTGENDETENGDRSEELTSVSSPEQNSLPITSLHGEKGGASPAKSDNRINNPGSNVTGENDETENGDRSEELTSVFSPEKKSLPTNSPHGEKVRFTEVVSENFQEVPRAQNRSPELQEDNIEIRATPLSKNEKIPDLHSINEFKSYDMSSLKVLNNELSSYKDLAEQYRKESICWEKAHGKSCEEIIALKKNIKKWQETLESLERGIMHIKRKCEEIYVKGKNSEIKNFADILIRACDNIIDGHSVTAVGGEDTGDNSKNIISSLEEKVQVKDIVISDLTKRLDDTKELIASLESLIEEKGKLVKNISANDIKSPNTLKESSELLEQRNAEWSNIVKERDGLLVNLDKLSEENATLKNQVSVLTESKDKINKENNALEAQNHSLVAEKKALENKIDNITESNVRIKIERESLIAEIKELHKEKNSILNIKASLVEKINSTEKSVQKSEEFYKKRVDILNEDLSYSKDLFRQKCTQLIEQQKRHNLVKKEMKKNSICIEKHNETINKLNEQIKGLNRNNELKESELYKVSKQLSEISTLKKTQELDLIKCNEGLTRNAELLEKKNSLITELNNKIAEYKNFIQEQDAKIIELNYIKFEKDASNEYSINIEKYLKKVNDENMQLREDINLLRKRSSQSRSHIEEIMHQILNSSPKTYGALGQFVGENKSESFINKNNSHASESKASNIFSTSDITSTSIDDKLLALSSNNSLNLKKISIPNEKKIDENLDKEYMKGLLLKLIEIDKPYKKQFSSVLGKTLGFDQEELSKLEKFISRG